MLAIPPAVVSPACSVLDGWKASVGGECMIGSGGDKVAGMARILVCPSVCMHACLHASACVHAHVCARTHVRVHACMHLGEAMRRHDSI